MSNLQKANRYSRAVQANALVDIALDPEAAEKGYLARLLFHTMMPHSAQDAREWSRRNGSIEIHMQAGPGMNLPYGTYPRLIFAWIVTEAYRTKRRKLVLGDSLSHFMGQLGLLPTGGRWGTITQLREQMERLLLARIVARDSREHGSRARQLTVSDDYQLWWNPKIPEQTSLWESEIMLGERFFQEIVDSPFPFDMRVLRAVKRSPLGIDLYTWLTHRVSYLKEPVAISWAQLHGQFGGEYSQVKDFTVKAKRELVKIRTAWPELDYETPRGRLLLHPCRPSIGRTKPSKETGLNGG